MPSPVGHALAGAAIALAAEPLMRRGAPSFRVALLSCVALAALPDADLLYQPIHRAVTHSVGSFLLITIVATVVTGWVTRTWGVAFGLLCGVAWGSHLVLDWLGTDPKPPRGIKALWPFSQQWFISDLNIFRGTERRQLFTWASMIYNLKAIAQEIAILAPIAGALVFWRTRRERRGRASLRRG